MLTLDKAKERKREGTPLIAFSLSHYHYLNYFQVMLPKKIGLGAEGNLK